MDEKKDLMHPRFDKKTYRAGIHITVEFNKVTQAKPFSLGRWFIDGETICLHLCRNF
tara:strand:- start:98 stop:268 length:171 start_codon:yes stop_codon:yes gene_type:complete